jgi:hypothetical protein
MRDGGSVIAMVTAATTSTTATNGTPTGTMTRIVEAQAAHA